MIPLFKVFVSPNMQEPLMKTMNSGFLGEGPKNKEFEAALRKYIGCPNLLTVNSGTSALRLALRLAGVGPGDEVISTALTFFATNSPILEQGAHPVWADIDPLTGNIDPNSIVCAITPRTKAIIVVHFGGAPYDLNLINSVAKANNIKVIEDACQALGSLYDGSLIGKPHSDFVCFSFQAIKFFTTGDGGALVCKDPKDHERGRLLRWYGLNRDNPTKCGDSRCEDDVVDAGYKYHMGDISATIGLENLPYLEKNLEIVRDNARFYDDAIKETEGLGIRPMDGCAQSNYWFYTLHVVKNRDLFMKKMLENGIMCSKVHARNDTYSVFLPYRVPLPGVTRFYSTQCAIPCGWWVTEQDREFIVRTARKIIRET